jgi:hypothetical protein
MQPLSQDAQRHLTQTKSDRGRLRERPGSRPYRQADPVKDRIPWLPALKRGCSCQTPG